MNPAMAGINPMMPMMGGMYPGMGGMDPMMQQVDMENQRLQQELDQMSADRENRRADEQRAEFRQAMEQLQTAITAVNSDDRGAGRYGGGGGGGSPRSKASRKGAGAGDDFSTDPTLDSMQRSVGDADPAGARRETLRQSEGAELFPNARAGTPP